MASEVPGKLVPYEAGEDLSTYQYCFVKLDTAGKAVHCDTAGEVAVGVLQNDPVSGGGATVMISGITKVKASTAVAIGAPIAPAVTTGKGVTATATSVSTTTVVGGNVAGYAETAAAATDEIFTMRITQSGIVPTTVA